ncbi:nuclear transport factor 2 family protein [Nocardia goodfellowii]
MSVSTREGTPIEADTVIDGEAFAVEAQRMTNHASIGEWLELYHPDAVADWIVDGAREHHEGIAEIRPAATLMAALWRKHRFQVRKHLQCATGGCVVLTFEGTFDGRGTVTGTEIWTFRDGLVVGHRMSVYLDVRARASRWAQVRVLFTAPRIAASALRLERKYAGPQSDSNIVKPMSAADSRNGLSGREVRR